MYFPYHSILIDFCKGLHGYFNLIILPEGSILTIALSKLKKGVDVGEFYAETYANKTPINIIERTNNDE